ncbi:MAG: hypothetical protein R3C03_17340 [Pirellulaceae bacterium]
MKVHLAIDLGAESGRVIAVWLDRGTVHYEELHRFGHQAVSLPTGLHWNITRRIWADIVLGLKQAAEMEPQPKRNNYICGSRYVGRRLGAGH